jgi:Cu(I)-responsive transcriptional regulator
MNIGEASETTGVSAKMIRYYEETGLIRPASRTQSGYRVYADNDIQTLRFVRRARDLGFTVAQIEELLALWRDRSRASSDVKRIATDHIAELQKKMRELQEMVTTLSHLAHNCHGDDRPDCPILTSLGEDEGTGATRKSSSLGKGFEKKADARR